MIEILHHLVYMYISTRIPVPLAYEVCLCKVMQDFYCQQCLSTSFLFSSSPEPGRRYQVESLFGGFQKLGAPFW